MTGGNKVTVTLALAVLPVPPSEEATLTLLFCTPANIPFTLTLNVHEPPAGNVPPLKVIVSLPAVAVTVPLPQVPATPLGVAITNPGANVSVNVIPVNGALPGAVLVMMKVRVVLLPAGMLDGTKVLAIVGGGIGTT